MTKITEDEVGYVAKLARINLDGEEVQSMTGQLDRILSYIDKLNSLDTQGVMPTTHAISVSNAFRDDETGKSLDHDAALANGPRRNDEAFIVPKII